MDASDIDIIIREREKLLKRLMMRSPMLRFAPSKSAGGNLDAFKLLAGEDQENGSLLPKPKALPVGKYFSTLLASGSRPTAASIRFTSSASYAARCRRLILLNQDHYRSTGNWSLYLGYPLLYWTLPQYKLARCAPLFIWKVALQLDGKAIYIFRPDEADPTQAHSKRREPEEPKFNLFLKSLILREQQVSVDLSAEDVNFRNVGRYVSEFHKQWSDCNISNFQKELAPYESPDIDGPAIFPYATIGRGSFQGAAIAEDLQNLANKVETDKSTGCLEYLLAKPVEQETNEAPTPQEDKKYIVAASDPSQEKILWQTAVSKVTLIHGPPGTGKSQTIVNLISAALARSEKIVVACHHDAALTVVKRRLDDCQLGKYAIKINDTSKDRKPVLESIRELNSAPEASMNVAEIVESRKFICSKIIHLEEVLEQAHEKLYGKPYANESACGALLSLLHAVKQVGFNTYYPKFRTFLDTQSLRGYKQLSDARKEIDIVKKYVVNKGLCDYRNNPWRFLKMPIDVNRDELSGSIEEILQLLSRSNLDNRIIHTKAEAWYAEHPLLMHYYPGFSPNHTLQKQFNILHGKIRDYLSSVLEEECVDDLVASLRDGTGEPILESFRTNLISLDTLIEVIEVYNKSALIQALYSLEDVKMDIWHRSCEAAIAHNILKERGKLPNPTAINENRNHLQQALKLKRNVDYMHICTNFAERLSAAADLKTRRLLMLRGGSKPKTELRTLYHEAFDTVAKIYPVLLTSFDTASKILPLQSDLIDTLIIDEASQVYSSDAMALFYRAKRTIVSGDDMQMPPSDYFETSEAPTENDQSKPEGESILLEALGLSIRVDNHNYKMLNIHYRSNFPELIQFSNYVFYKGELEVPPSSASPLPYWNTPVAFHQVAGTFSDGINAIEIDAVISQLKKIWQYVSNQYSIGIIVSNVTQRDELLQRLSAVADSNEKFKKDLEVSHQLTKNRMSEGLFVRSVEHVQGDERDIIIYSTTYGQSSRNYGPLSNRDKGRRRLNVAITRAKYAMVVITSLNIDHISNETEGKFHAAESEVKERWYLWKYLKYAKAISEGDYKFADKWLSEFVQGSQIEDTTRMPDSEFEVSVSDFLRVNGYHVQPQVSESGFRIDLGIKSHESDMYYICGVECDGAKYHSGWAARHRDVWRQTVLEDKGWKIARVWSTQWYDDVGASTARNNLLKEIRGFLTTGHTNSE